VSISTWKGHEKTERANGTVDCNLGPGKEPGLNREGGEIPGRRARNKWLLVDPRTRT